MVGYAYGVELESKLVYAVRRLGPNIDNCEDADVRDGVRPGGWARFPNEFLGDDIYYSNIREKTRETRRMIIELVKLVSCPLVPIEALKQIHVATFTAL